MSYETGVYDFYDDGGDLLKMVVPDMGDLPDFVKTASAMDQAEPGNLFALILVDEGKVMKKFATADRGNTWLSTLYFAQTKDNLPEEAQKVAAANLVEACEHYDISPPDFLFDIADQAVNTNLVDVSHARPPMQKVAHPLLDRPEMEKVEYAIERADGSKHYPIGDQSSVKTANDYFSRNVGQFVPRDRREYAVKTAEQSKKMGLPVSPEIKKYASTGWNPSLQGHLTSRYLHLIDADAPIEYKEELTKLAQAADQATPDEFAIRLEAFDKSTGLDDLWDHALPDPWMSTLGMEKTAKGEAILPRTYRIGETTVTEEELLLLAERGYRSVEKSFGHEISQAFAKNPIPVFESMPLPQKKLFARMASDHMGGVGG